MKDSDILPEIEARSSARRRRALLTGGGIAVAGWSWARHGYRCCESLGQATEIFPASRLSANWRGRGRFRRPRESPSGWIDARSLILDGAACCASRPCQAIYGTPPGDAVPVAVFSDAEFRNCRAPEGLISDFESAMLGAIHVVRHHLPLLGASSVTAARAALAARRQGGEEEMWHRLTGMPPVTDAAVISSAADAAGLEPDRLLAEMHGSSVNETLRNSRAIAEAFGFLGTPATAVGRTVYLKRSRRRISPGRCLGATRCARGLSRRYD